MITITMTDIAKRFDLWQEYADPMGTMSENEFYTLSTQDKYEMLINCGFKFDEEE